MEKAKQDIPVECLFTKDGEYAKDLILQSFRVFIDRKLLNNVDFLTKQP